MLEELKALKAKVRVLEASKGAVEVLEADGESSATTTEADKATAKAMQKQIQELKDMDSGLRAILCESKGGYEVFLAELERKLQELWAKQREQRPLAQQKASAEAHLRKMQKARDESASQLSKLHQQQQEVVKQVAEQEAAVAVAEAKLQKATLEAVAIAEKATAELRGAEGAVPASPSVANSQVTAAAVKGFFQSLPSVVSGDPEGRETIQQVMDLLEKLDGAAKQVAASSDARPPGHDASETAKPQGHWPEQPQETMDLDDDLLGQMAEAAVAPEEGEGLAAEDRKTKVAETKARLKSEQSPRGRVGCDFLSQYFLPL